MKEFYVLKIVLKPAVPTATTQPDQGLFTASFRVVRRIWAPSAKAALAQAIRDGWRTYETAVQEVAEFNAQIVAAKLRKLEAHSRNYGGNFNG